MDNGRYAEVPEEELVAEQQPVAGEVVDEADQAPERAEPIRAAPVIERAANGDVLAPPSMSMGTLIDLLEDGQFSREGYDDLKRLGEALKLHAANGMKAKGKVTLTIDFEQEGEALHVRGDIKVKMPELPRRKSIVWTDDNGDFCRFPPRQAQMFGGRAPRVIG